MTNKDENAAALSLFWTSLELITLILCSHNVVFFNANIFQIQYCDASIFASTATRPVLSSFLQCICPSFPSSFHPSLVRHFFLPFSILLRVFLLSSVPLSILITFVSFAPSFRSSVLPSVLFPYFPSLSYMLSFFLPSFFPPVGLFSFLPSLNLVLSFALSFCPSLPPAVFRSSFWQIRLSEQASSQ